jgi:hypothetical protein
MDFPEDILFCVVDPKKEFIGDDVEIKQSTNNSPQSFPQSFPQSSKYLDNSFVNFTPSSPSHC